MDKARIAELLKPFLQCDLVDEQLNNISIYIDMLVKWNQRINLTAVRQPEQIVTRHFGESLFAAQTLFPVKAGTPASAPRSAEPNVISNVSTVIDVGSGAGFPGLPIKIWSPGIRLTLIESNHKKATFLKEVARVLELAEVDVFAGRAETFAAASADVVTLRAVEQFEKVLPVAAGLLKPAGRLALLIGSQQIAQAKPLAGDFEWGEGIPIPLSDSRRLLVGTAKTNSSVRS